MLIQAAHHYSIDVSDIEVARSFYGGLLGLAEIDRPDFGIPGVWYQAGPIQLHLLVVPEGVNVGTLAPSLTPLAPHIAFEIESYEQMEKTLSEAGFEFKTTGPVSGQIFVQDPDGNTIEFIDPSPTLGRS
ncbi:MAG: glyoxalase [Deltaproteobacteria bacterium]|nr:glyoxalase [Deltaproteobacteria bacterium]